MTIFAFLPISQSFSFCSFIYTSVKKILPVSSQTSFTFQILKKLSSHTCTLTMKTNLSRQNHNQNQNSERNEFDLGLGVWIPLLFDCRYVCNTYFSPSDLVDLKIIKEWLDKCSKELWIAGVKDWMRTWSWIWSRVMIR